MWVIESANVNDAYREGMNRLSLLGQRSDSRAGRVIVAPGPVMNIYSRPRERVLFDANRDANPFFHIVEAVWMIAGRRDATLLDRYVHDFSARFAEDNGNAHGAYGWRWRNHFEDPNGRVVDQIAEAGRLLRENPESRQVVMAMWDPAADLGARKRDIPCNDLVMFRAIPSDGGSPTEHELDMTIVARSHDAVWGAYGANMVHMTVMHEVVAALANMRVGTYRHLSNNFHVYEAVLPRIGDWTTGTDHYRTGEAYSQRICATREEAELFVSECEQLCRELAVGARISEPESVWLRDTVVPMITTHREFKAGVYETAISAANEVQSTDWALAAEQWLKRRQARREANGAFA